MNKFHHRHRYIFFLTRPLHATLHKQSHDNRASANKKKKSISNNRAIPFYRDYHSTKHHINNTITSPYPSINIHLQTYHHHTNHFNTSYSYTILMPNNNNNNNNNNDNSDNTIIYRFEKGNYVSFNSINPHQSATYSNQKEGETFSGIIEEAGNGSVVIRSRGLEYRRDENFVTLISKQHRYLRCREPSRKPWHRSIGSGYIFLFDPNGKPAGYKKEPKIRTPSKRILVSSPYLLLTENNTCYTVDTRTSSPTFTEATLDPPLPPPSIITLPPLNDTTTPHPTQYTLITTLQSPPPSPIRPSFTPTSLTLYKTSISSPNTSKYFN